MAAAPSTLAELGPRLRAVAEFVLPGQPMADLCCDHAYLATALVASGRVPRAIAGDLNAGPLAQAREGVAAAGLEGRVDLRLGDGAQVLTPGGVDGVATVTLAGIGAGLAGRLVAEGGRGGHLEGVARLVVQANDVFPRLGQLRAELASLGWQIVDERLALEARRIYVTLACAPLEVGTRRVYSERERDLGPVLGRGVDPLYGEWLTRERERVTRALAGMARSQSQGQSLARAPFEAWLARLDDELSRQPGRGSPSPGAGE